MLDDDGPQESDTLDARIARDTGLSVKTVRNLRSALAGEGLIKAHPLQRHDDGHRRTLGRRPHPRTQDARVKTTLPLHPDSLHPELGNLAEQATFPTTYLESVCTGSSHYIPTAISTREAGQ